MRIIHKGFRRLGLKAKQRQDWTNLKTFVQECYTRQLNASSITSGAHGYVQNAFAVLKEESEEEDDDVQTVITQMAALTTQSQLTATTTAETSASVAAAINQLNANQQAMQQQFAAFTTQLNMTYHPAPTVQPPTCPAPWRRANHQEGFDRNNAGQYIGAGYNACTKAMHKSQLPNM